MRAILFQHASTQQSLGVVIQWNCHPEALRPHNTSVTADFCYATIRQLQSKLDCPIVYFSGALGGLMAPPKGLFHDSQGNQLQEGQFAYAEAYGRAVAELGKRATRTAQPVRLTPVGVSQASIAIPVRNALYRTARLLGVVNRLAIQWTGGFRVASQPARPGKNSTYAVKTEVACLALGDLIAFCVPGELYPELVYGQFEDPPEPNVDYPNAPTEKTIIQMVSQDQKWMLFGLANDEIGCIIPQRQWDRDPPYAYDRRKAQYGEVNSCGFDVAPIIIQALGERRAALRN